MDHSITPHTQPTHKASRSKLSSPSPLTSRHHHRPSLLLLFSQSFWKKTMTTTKKIQEEEEEEEQKPSPGGGVVVGSTSTSTSATPGGPDDRISELPVEILQHILGFLVMDEFLIGTSLVSTKWRYLWKSVSTLNFTHFPPVSSSSSSSISRIDSGSVGSDGDSVEKYHNFVDHVLRLRDSEASKIQIFRYYCYYSNSREGGGGGGGYEDYLERLHNFIVSAAVNQGAQEILIMGEYLDGESSSDNNNNNRIIHFNPSIFTSGRLLRKFTFFVFPGNFQILFPRSMCCAATQLTHLTLSRIRLPEGDAADAQLHLVCPVLETFYMNCCYSEHLKVLDISAPRLNSLSIRNMTFGGYDILGGCRIEIHTPNLTSLAYYGRVYVDCFTENLPRIADATLHFIKEPGMVVEQTTSFAIKLLKGLTSAESLTLAGFEFVITTNTDPKGGNQLRSFTSLRILNLITSCKISSIHGMVHFLNCCNSLEILVWDVNKKCTVEGDDEHLMLPQCSLSHLKHVHIRSLRGHENEIEFVKFLLKSSVVLEDLIINTTADSPKQSIEENLQQFIEKEPSFKTIKLCVLQQTESIFSAVPRVRNLAWLRKELYLQSSFSKLFTLQTAECSNYILSYADVGNAYVDCFMGNLPSLASAVLNFVMETGMVEESTLFAIKLLKGVSSAAHNPSWN